jgi:hypothetical protein
VLVLPRNWTYGHKCNEVKKLLHAIQLQGHFDEEDEIPILAVEAKIQDHIQAQKTEDNT